MERTCQLDQVPKAKRWNFLGEMPHLRASLLRRRRRVAEWNYTYKQNVRPSLTPNPHEDARLAVMRNRARWSCGFANRSSPKVTCQCARPSKPGLIQSASGRGWPVPDRRAGRTGIGHHPPTRIREWIERPDSREPVIGRRPPSLRYRLAAAMEVESGANAIPRPGRLDKPRSPGEWTRPETVQSRVPADRTAPSNARNRVADSPTSNPPSPYPDEPAAKSPDRLVARKDPCETSWDKIRRGRKRCARAGLVCFSISCEYSTCAMSVQVTYLPVAQAHPLLRKWTSD